MKEHTPKTAKKDVIYIDIDDEITAIIDKVRSSSDRVVALVLPKRATMLQSIVNMKLLKRTGEESKKQVVLISAEAGLMPLAGNVGLYVAKSLNSKPEIPHSSEQLDGQSDDEETVDMEDKELDTSKSVGDYSKSVKPSAISPDDIDEEAPIELDNTVAAPSDSPVAKAKKAAKKLKIPDFNKFRLYIALGAGGFILLLIVIWLAFFQLPKASIAVTTDSIALDASADVTFKTDTQELKTDAAIVPAQSQQVEKTSSQEVPATGEKNNGEKATGDVKIINCTAGTSLTIPAGTGVTSAGLTFIMQTTVTIPVGSATCQDFPGATSKSVTVVAQSAGAKYNLAASSFTVAGYESKTKASSAAAMAGGTDAIVKVVQQSDIDSAKDKLAAQDGGAAKLELQTAIEKKSLFAIPDSLTTSASDTTTSAKVGDEAANVSVTQKTTFAMLGVKKGDLEKVLAQIVKDKIDEKKQAILSYGLDKATFKPESQDGNNTLMSVQSTVVAGTDLDLASIKKQVAGKKANDAREIIKKYPGVTDVKVDYSPFWVSSIPKSAGKITITVKQPKIQDAR